MTPHTFCPSFVVEGSGAKLNGIILSHAVAEVLELSLHSNFIVSFIVLGLFIF